jgi:hypothetical protein
MKNYFLSSLTLTFCLACSSIVAHAQPEQPAPAKVEKAPMEAAIENHGEMMKKMMAMTPAQMQQEMLRLQRIAMQTTFKQAGLNDLELQDTIWQWLMDQEKARRDVRKAARKVYLGITPGGAALTDQQLEEAIADYQAAAEDEKARREIAVAELDKKIGFSTKPRLRALLMMNGYIGDEAWFSTSSMMAGAMAMGSLNLGGDD